MKNHTRRISAFAALGVAAALSLTACAGGDSGKDTAGKGSVPPAASSQPSDPAKASPSPSGGTADKGKSQTAKPSSGSTASGSSGDSAPQGGQNVQPCKTQNLTVEAKNASPDASTGTIDITMTNRGTTTCSATGFAGIGITDQDTTTNPIERGKAEPRITDLKPGEAAIFNLSYEIDNSANSLTRPTEIQVTPPNQTSHVNVKWPAGAGNIKGFYTDVKVYPTHNK
ncbi:DUF4232 domain-containing protein [Kitasatospora indigofera]|uniref:DUF4232 domain-containing protein n=1 Tax=Kitasatospora indigofera TaxID=67307 RepID=UPI00365D4AC3